MIWSQAFSISVKVIFRLLSLLFQVFLLLVLQSSVNHTSYRDRRMWITLLCVIVWSLCLKLSSVNVCWWIVLSGQSSVVSVNHKSYRDCGMCYCLITVFVNVCWWMVLSGQSSVVSVNHKSYRDCGMCYCLITVSVNVCWWMVPSGQCSCRRRLHEPDSVVCCVHSIHDVSWQSWTGIVCIYLLLVQTLAAILRP